MKELDAIAIVHDAQDRRGYLLAKERRQVHRQALLTIKARATALKNELRKNARKAQRKKEIIQGWSKVVRTFARKIKQINAVRNGEKWTSEDDKSEEHKSEDDKSEEHKSEEDKSEEDKSEAETFYPF